MGSEEGQLTAEGPKLGTGGKIVVGAVAAITLIMFAGTLPDRSGGAGASLAEIEAGGRDSLKRSLMDYGSAEIEDEFAKASGKGGALCGRVNAKNGLGAFTGFTRFIAGAGTDSPVYFERDMDADLFGGLWKVTCLGQTTEQALADFKAREAR